MEHEPTTVLVVDNESLPPALMKVLEFENCWIETVDIQDVAAALLVAEPDIVVCHHEQVTKLPESFGSESCNAEQPRLLVVSQPGHKVSYPPHILERICCTVFSGLSIQEIAHRLRRHLHKSASPFPPPAVQESQPRISIQGPSKGRFVTTSINVTSQTGTNPLTLIARDSSHSRRAASLVELLMAKGHRVVLASESAADTLWSELRRLGPQGLVMMEGDPCVDHGEWLQTFRSDPFLRFLPSVVVPRASLHAWTPSLAGVAELGRFEAGLRTNLSGGREIGFDLPDIGLWRLLKVLQEENVHAQMSASIDGEVLRWGVRGNEVTFALLEAGRHQKLSPAKAMEWLLLHDDARVLLRVVDRLNARAQASISELLEHSLNVTPLPLPRRSGVRPVPALGRHSHTLSAVRLHQGNG